MKTGITQDEQLFRPINLKYLKGEFKERFEIYYKTEAFGAIQYVLFVSADPEHQDKARRLIEEKEGTEEFFIKEEDLSKYFGQATAGLREMISNPELPLEEKTKKIYDVSKEIMKDFFEFNASPKILQSSEQVVEIMDDCLSDADADFHAIFKVTSNDYYTYTHSVNVGLYCLAYGVKTGMSSNDIRNLGLAGMLHDVGKSSIDPNILNKNGKLTGEEFELIKGHSPKGQKMLEDMQCYPSCVIDVAGQHHEKYDGKGYPYGLAGEEIALFARICKVTDVYDALTTRRSYKKALTPFDALVLMRKQMDNEFDLEILGKFIRFMGPGL
jgi:HD-GYP domain-containing protein (c-di-GMP phosphodiesterase class II)